MQFGASTGGRHPRSSGATTSTWPLSKPRRTRCHVRVQGGRNLASHLATYCLTPHTKCLIWTVFPPFCLLTPTHPDQYLDGIKAFREVRRALPKENIFNLRYEDMLDEDIRLGILKRLVEFIGALLNFCRAGPPGEGGGGKFCCAHFDQMIVSGRLRRSGARFTRSQIAVLSLHMYTCRAEPRRHSPGAEPPVDVRVRTG